MIRETPSRLVTASTSMPLEPMSAAGHVHGGSAKAPWVVLVRDEPHGRLADDGAGEQPVAFSGDLRVVDGLADCFFEASSQWRSHRRAGWPQRPLQGQVPRLPPPPRRTLHEESVYALSSRVSFPARGYEGLRTDPTRWIGQQHRGPLYVTLYEEAQHGAHRGRDRDQPAGGGRCSISLPTSATSRYNSRMLRASTSVGALR